MDLDLFVLCTPIPVDIVVYVRVNVFVLVV